MVAVQGGAPLDEDGLRAVTERLKLPSHPQPCGSGYGPEFVEAFIKKYKNRGSVEGVEPMLQMPVDVAFSPGGGIVGPIPRPE